MRGLPPVPADVLEIRWSYSFAGSDASSTTFYFVAGASSYGRAAAIDVADAITFDWLALLSHLTTSELQLADRELLVHGDELIHDVKPITPNHGLWPGASTVNAAVGVYWTTGQARRRGHAFTYFPSFPPDFSDDAKRLNSNGFDTIRDAAFSYLDALTGIPTPNHAQVIPVLVSKALNGAPRPAAVVFPIDGAIPCKHVADMGRRLGQTRRVVSA